MQLLFNELFYFKIHSFFKNKIFEFYPQRFPPNCSTRLSVAFAAQAQLAATPAPPCPEFSTVTNPPEFRLAPILKPSFLIGRSVFQLTYLVYTKKKISSKLFRPKKLVKTEIEFFENINITHLQNPKITFLQTKPYKHHHNQPM